MRTLLEPRSESRLSFLSGLSLLCTSKTSSTCGVRLWTPQPPRLPDADDLYSSEKHIPHMYFFVIECLVSLSSRDSGPPPDYSLSMKQWLEIGRRGSRQ